MNNRYEIIQFLDEGGQGKVYLAYDTLTKNKVCIKQVALPAIEEKRGITFTKDIQHPSLVKTLDTFEDDDYFYHVMNYIEGVSCRMLYKKLGKKQLRKITLQLLALLQEFQKANITFNDIKPDNLILSQENHIHLIDVGAILPEKDVMSLRYGSIYFASVEYVQNKETTWQGDVYSLGKTMQFLMKKPFFFLQLWVNKVTKASISQRFSQLDKASRYLHYDELVFKLLVGIIIFIGLCLFPLQQWAYQKEIKKENYLNAMVINSSKDEAYELYLLENRTYDELILLQKKGVMKSSERIKMKLAELLAENFSADGWNFVDALYSSCDNEKAKKRLEIMNDLAVQFLLDENEKNDIAFYMRCLFYTKKLDLYQDVWEILKTKDIQEKGYWMVQIGFELGRIDLLLSCISDETDAFVCALSYYRMFELGYYQEGYLHLARERLEGQSNTWLYQEIEHLIHQWGDKA